MDANRNGAASSKTWAARNSEKDLDSKPDYSDAAPDDGGMQLAEHPASNGDYLSDIHSDVLNRYKAAEGLRQKVESQHGIAWKELAWALQRLLPAEFEDANNYAFKVLVRFVLDQTYGPEGSAWESYRNEQAERNKDGSAPVYARALKKG